MITFIRGMSKICVFQALFSLSFINIFTLFTFICLNLLIFISLLTYNIM